MDSKEKGLDFGKEFKPIFDQIQDHINYLRIQRDQLKLSHQTIVELFKNVYDLIDSCTGNPIYLQSKLEDMKSKIKESLDLANKTTTFCNIAENQSMKKDS